MSLRDLPKKFNEKRLRWGMTPGYGDPEKIEKLSINPQRARQHIEELIQLFRHEDKAGHRAKSVLEFGVAGARLKPEETEEILENYILHHSPEHQGEYPGDWRNTVEMFVHVPGLPAAQLEKLWPHISSTEEGHWQIETHQTSYNQDRREQQLQIIWRFLQQADLPAPLQKKAAHILTQTPGSYPRQYHLREPDMREKLFQASSLRTRSAIREVLIGTARRWEEFEVLAQDRECQDLAAIFKRVCQTSSSQAMEWLRENRFQLRERLGSQAPTLLLAYGKVDQETLRTFRKMDGWSNEKKRSRKQ